MNDIKKIGLDIINQVNNEMPDVDIYFKTNNENVEITFMRKGKFYTKTLDKIITIDYDENSIIEEIKNNLGVN